MPNKQVQVLDYLVNLKNQVLSYFMTLTQYQQYSYMAIFLGIILVILAIILW